MCNNARFCSACSRSETLKQTKSSVCMPERPGTNAKWMYNIEVEEGPTQIALFHLAAAKTTRLYHREKLEAFSPDGNVLIGAD